MFHKVKKAYKANKFHFKEQHCTVDCTDKYESSVMRSYMFYPKNRHFHTCNWIVMSETTVVRFHTASPSSIA